MKTFDLRHFLHMVATERGYDSWDDCLVQFNTNPLFPVDKFESILTEAAERFKNQSQWIGVDERLPEYGAVFVIAHKKNGIILGLYYNADRQFMYGKEDQTNQVTHWCPLPQKP